MILFRWYYWSVAWLWTSWQPWQELSKIIYFQKYEPYCWATPGLCVSPFLAKMNSKYYNIARPFIKQVKGLGGIEPIDLETEYDAEWLKKLYFHAWNSFSNNKKFALSVLSSLGNFLECFPIYRYILHSSTLLRRGVNKHLFVD